MNILAKLSLRYMLMNRKRTLVTVVAVMLAGALIFSVVSLAQSGKDMVEQYRNTEMGDYHRVYGDIRWSQVKTYLEADSESQYVEAAMFNKLLGFVALQAPKNDLKPYIAVRAMDTESFAGHRIKLEAGRLPENDGEIVLSRMMLDVEKTGYAIGDEIKLDVGWRLVTSGAVMNDIDPAKFPDDKKVLVKTEININSGSREEIKQTVRHTYKVVGTIAYTAKDDDLSAGYPAYTYLDTTMLADTDTVDMNVRFYDPSIQYNIKGLETAAGFPGSLVQDVESDSLYISNVYGLNGFLTLILGAHSGADMVSFFRSIIFVVLLMILFATVTVIYNSFTISVDERKKQYGLLKSVGTTSLQLRTGVYFEAFAVSLVGIPLGLLCGYLGVSAVLRTLAMSFINMTDGRVKIRVAADPAVILGAAALIFAVVFVSAIIPAIRVSRMSPMEAIRQSRKVRNKKAESGKGIFTRIFGFEAALALKNLRRSSRKYITAVLSLVISVVIILAFASFGDYAKRSAEAMFGRTTYDIQIASQDFNQTEEDNQKILSFLNKNPNVIRYSKVTMQKTFKMPVTEDMLTRRSAKEFPDLTYLYTFVYTLDDETFRRYAASAGFKAEDFMDPQHPRAVYVVKNGGYLEYYTVTQKFGGPLINLKPGDSVELQIDPEYGTLAELTVGALAHELPVGLTTQKTEFIFVIPEAIFDAVMADYKANYGTSFRQYFADIYDETVFQREFREAFGDGYNENDYIIYNQRADRLKEQAMGSIVGTLGMMYILVICCIGILNVYNTVNTAMELRRKEFFILKSVGMTPRGLGRMLDSESVFFSLASLLVGVPAGILASYYVYRAYTHAADLGFTPPWLAMLAAAVGVFIAVYGTMFFFRRRIRNEPIVDTLRQENF